MLPVVIFAGGQGLRMGDYMPKPLVPVGGRPLVSHVIDCFASQGCDHFTLLVQDLQRDLFEDAFRGDRRVHILPTGNEAPTAHRLRRFFNFHRKFQTEPPAEFFLTYADGVANVDLKRLAAQTGCLRGTRLLTVTAVQPQNPYGVLSLGTFGGITEFSEKPKMDCWVNAGFCVVSREIVDYIPPDVLSWEQAIAQPEVLPRVAAYKHHSFWKSVDTLKDLRELEAIHATGERPWLVHGGTNANPDHGP